ncbi:MAG: hypothetical protein PHW01_01585 [Patescibacteria group bacterium]|nr:hypothetical protein [Patescibacteria group bacterium]
MLIVSFVIGLIAAILVANMRKGNEETNLRFAVQNMANVLRQAQTMVAGGKIINGSVPGGCGVYLTSNNVYTFFADKNDNGQSDSGEALEVITLPSKITMNPINDTIIFKSPHGAMWINGHESLTITFTNSIGHIGTVFVDASSGLIESSF